MNNERVIELLNKAISAELQAILQYTHQAFVLDDAGFGALSEQIMTIAKTEMHHVEQFALRVLLLGGIPTATIAPPAVALGQPISALLQTDIALEGTAISDYRQFGELCAQQGDLVSHDLFAHILDEEEQHKRALERVAEFVGKLGASYLAILTGGCNGQD